MKATALFALVLFAACATRSEVSRQEATAPADHFAEMDGSRIHYIDAGSGDRTLVFVHGWSCEASFWRFQIEPFAVDHRVLAIDLPGHGESDVPKVAYSMDFLARSIAAVLDDAEVERAVVIGHSNGTPVVRQFYRLYPARTAGLVAVDGALRNFFASPAQVEPLLAALRAPDYRDFAESFITPMMTSLMSDELRAEVTETMLSTPQHVMVSSFAAATDPVIWESDTIDVPLLVLVAEAPHWTEDYVAYVHSLAPQVDYRVMSRIGHFVMMERPEEFNRHLAEFLAAEDL